jgi:uncharacterized protein involved in outer membrane biogenesis
MKRFLVRILMVLAVLVVVTFLLLNFITRKVVEVGVKHKTGFPLQIGSVNFGVFGGNLEVQNLQLMNPPEFEQKMFVDLPAFKVDYRTLSMLTGSPHINEINVNVAEVIVVKNAKGQTNAQVLQARVNPPSAGTSQTKGGGQPKPEPSGGAHYRVDLVRVHVGTVRILDYSKGARLFEKNITLNKDIVFKDVTESTSITALVMRTVFGQVGEVAGEFVKGLNETTKGMPDSLQKSAQGLMESLKKALPVK